MEGFDKAKVHARLRRIAGQVLAVDRMIDEKRTCEEVMVQINAAKNALHRAAQLILEGWMAQCVRDAVKDGDAEKSIAAFATAVDRFANMGNYCGGGSAEE